MSRLESEENVTLEQLMMRGACEGRYKGLRVLAWWSIKREIYMIEYAFWCTAAYCAEAGQWFVRETNSESAAPLVGLTKDIQWVTNAQAVSLDTLRGIRDGGYPYVVKRRMGIVA